MACIPQHESDKDRIHRLETEVEGLKQHYTALMQDLIDKVDSLTRHVFKLIDGK